jgi:hypothetical protein
MQSISATLPLQFKWSQDLWNECIPPIEIDWRLNSSPFGWYKSNKRTLQVIVRRKCCRLLCYCNLIDLYARLSKVGQFAHMGCKSKSWGLSIITGAMQKGSDNTIIPLPGGAVAASPIPSTVTLTFCIGAPITDILGAQHRQKATQISWNSLKVPFLENIRLKGVTDNGFFGESVAIFMSTDYSFKSSWNNVAS